MLKTTNTTSFSQRNYGIDLLRLVASFYVVLLHNITLGGLYRATTPLSYQELLCRILLIITFCCVNIFGIISGYVGYREPCKKTSYFGYFPLWLTVVFYSTIYAGIYINLFPSQVNTDNLTQAFSPLICNLYWYFSGYTFVYFLAPYLNKLLYHSSDRELKQLLFVIFVFFVTVEYIGGSFEMEGGYSAVWLMLLYLIGGILKKTGIGSTIPSWILALAIILLDFAFFFLGYKQPIIMVSVFVFNFSVGSVHTNPFFLATAMLHVLLFARVRIPELGKKFIKFAAPASFSVYIVNTNPLLWDFSLRDRFVPWAYSSPAGILVRNISFTSVFVIIVVFLDFFRQKLFQLLRVQDWLPKLYGFLHREKVH